MGHSDWLFGLMKESGHESLKFKVILKKAGMKKVIIVIDNIKGYQALLCSPSFICSLFYSDFKHSFFGRDADDKKRRHSRLVL